MSLIYNAGIFLFDATLRLISPFHGKAREMIRGRRGWKIHLEKALKGWQNPIWIHCASLGEFEQGRSLIEAIKREQPDRKILLTFFSPSGYEIRKNYAQADHVCYLPLDTPANAKAFLQIVRPSLAIFVKYDIWLNVLAECRRKGTPVVLISALLRPESKFLKSGLAEAYREAFRGMNHIFTQDHETKELLSAFCTEEQLWVSGDTRFDRAIELPEKFVPIPEVEAFVRGRTCIVAGSPWPKDEALILPVIEKLRNRGICWILAPHEIHPDRIEQACRHSKGMMVRFSEIDKATGKEDVLWIDNIGMLSRLYHYASICYIGGGFGSGIHNTQEPAVYGNPVIFGPRYQKFREAVDMVKYGGAVSIEDEKQLETSILNWIENPALLEEIRGKNRAYMLEMSGATSLILRTLKESGLLNSA